MATANYDFQSSMSDEAFELINCFYDGVDVIVRELAQEIAVERNSFLDGQPQVVAIEEEDVREAGRRVLKALRALIKTDMSSPELRAAVENMANSIGDRQTEQGPNGE